MPFEARVFKLAKDTEHPEQYQDAFALDAAAGIATMADGVTSAIFSRQWANILTEAVASRPPDPEDTEAFADWLAEQRQKWSQEIDTTGLAWFQRAKLPNGAFSTLLWVRMIEIQQQQEGAFGAFRLQGFAIGDTVLIHVRGGEVVRTFPIQHAAELQSNPVVLGSVDLNRDRLVQFSKLDVLCYADDLLVLCTDAVAEWALRLMEAGDPPAWDDYWDVSQQQWEQEVVELRSQRQMRYDDATLALLRVVTEQATVEQPEEELPTIAEVIRPERTSKSDDHEPADEDDDWKEKFKTAGEQMAEGIEIASDQMLRGLKKWKKKAAKLYRDKFGK